MEVPVETREKGDTLGACNEALLSKPGQSMKGLGEVIRDSKENITMISAVSVEEFQVIVKKEVIEDVCVEEAKTVVTVCVRDEMGGDTQGKLGRGSKVSEVEGGLEVESHSSGVDRSSLQCHTCHRFLKNRGALATHMKSHSRNIRTGKVKPSCENPMNNGIICSQLNETEKNSGVKEKEGIVLIKEKPAQKVSQQREERDGPPIRGSSLDGCSKSSADCSDNFLQCKAGGKELSSSFQCGSCSESFCGENMLRAHMITHAQIQKNLTTTCLVCSRNNDDKNLDNNCQCDQSSGANCLPDDEPAKGNRHVCTVCRKTFLTLTDLKSHMKLEHEGHPNSLARKVSVETKSNSKIFRCEECRKKFVDKAQFLRHIKLHLLSPKDNFKCSICKQPFKYEGFLVKHIQKCHPGESKDNIQVVDSGCERWFDEKAGVDDMDHRAFQSCGLFTKEKSNVCVICNKVIARARDIERHMRTHSGERHKCEQCGKLFARKDGLLNHKRVVHCDAFFSHPTNTSPGGRYQCSQCGKEFASRVIYNMHKASHRNVKAEFKCSSCTGRFFNEGELQEHIKAFHSNSFKCVVCGRSFKYISTYDRHMKSHSSDTEMPHVCVICNRSFDCSYKLRKHSLTHKKDKHFKCEACGKVFFNKALFKQHERRHVEDKVHPCAVCGQIFKQKISAKRHELMHSGNHNHECSVCGKKFEMKYQLNRHMVVHAKATIRRNILLTKRGGSVSQKVQEEKSIMTTNQEPFIAQEFRGKDCKVCHKVFKTYNSLKGHMRTHLGIRYKCDFCPKSFARFNVLRSHLRVMHKQIVVNSKKAVTGQVVRHEVTNNKLLFRCPVCGLVFIHRNELEAHTKIHTGEKPYECELCAEKFNSRDRLQEHLDSGHEVKTIVCPVCSTRFKRKADLARHMRTHNKSSACRCVYCGKIFARKDNLAAHVKRVHRGLE